MPASVQSIIHSATAEWERWGKTTWNCITHAKKKGHIDDEALFSQHVLDAYVAPFNLGNGNPSTNQIENDEYFWSAVFISYVMRQAGLTKKEFPFSQAHATYIIASIRQRKTQQPAAYWGYRVDEAEAVPDVGDLVGYVRGKNMSRADILKYYDKTARYDSHTDIVVARRSGEIDVIGGNVLDSVTKKTLATNAQGQLIDTSHKWFVVMKNRL